MTRVVRAVLGGVGALFASLRVPVACTRAPGQAKLRSVMQLGWVMGAGPISGVSESLRLGQHLWRMIEWIGRMATYLASSRSPHNSLQ